MIQTVSLWQNRIMRKLYQEVSELDMERKKKTAKTINMATNKAWMNFTSQG